MPATVAGAVVWLLSFALGARAPWIDWRRLRRPWLGGLLAGALAAGFAAPVVSPFSFGGGGHYMEGALATLLAGLALGGYALLSLLLGLGASIRRRSSAPAQPAPQRPGPGL